MTKYKITLLLAPLVFSFAIAMDLYLPIVPHMQHVLSTSAENIQLTLSLFILSFGIGQLFIGPISDKYGRRYIVLISITVYAISSFLLALTTNIQLFILLRIIEALGACGAMVSAFAIAKDLESKISGARIYSYLNSIIALSPLLGPLIGSYIYLQLGWQACFFFLAILGFLGLIMILFGLPETLPIEKRAQINLNSFHNYWIILQNHQFLTYAFTSSVGFAIFFSFFSCAPYLLIEKLQVSVLHFGYYFGFVSLIFFLANVISAHICVIWGIFRTNIIGGIFLITGGTAMAISYCIFGLSITTFLLPMILIVFGAAFVISSGTTGAMTSFSSIAGTVSATLGCYQFLFASLVATLMMHVKITSTLPLATTVILLSSLALTGQFIRNFKRNKLKLMVTTASCNSEKIS